MPPSLRDNGRNPACDASYAAASKAQQACDFLLSRQEEQKRAA